MKSRRSLTIFFYGFVAGLGALAFNFIVRLGDLVAYPPESALSEVLKVIPASIEEPAVQAYGGFAGQLGLVIATLVGATVYGILAVAFDRLLARRLLSRSLSRFEALLVFAIVPWALFGLLLFPFDGDSLFGAASAFATPSDALLFPLTLLLVQGVFAWLLSSRYRPELRPTGAAPTRAPSRMGAARREFVEKGIIGIFALVAAVVGLSNLGSLLTPQIQPTGGSQPVDLAGAPQIFSDPRLTNLVDSEITPNGSFYQVDIDVIAPTVELATWSLTVDGLVGSPKTYTLDDLQALPSFSEYTTFECVSNTINGDLISTAKWTGVTLSDLFQDVGGVLSDGAYVVFYSVDGYSVAIPVSRAMMPDAMLAYMMNDQPLPTNHGYPLRAVNPGLYGMMSAKWLNRVSVVDSDYQGYWQTRGWTDIATINTVAFIATPVSGSAVSISQNGGSILLGGYAFAGSRGISKVEVSFDDGDTWQGATLKPPLSDLTWVLWAYEWTPDSTGEHFIYARATDGTGAVQSATVTDTFPNGATGYAYIDVDVTD